MRNALSEVENLVTRNSYHAYFYMTLYFCRLLLWQLKLPIDWNEGGLTSNSSLGNVE